jgi:hypothetical protein
VIEAEISAGSGSLVLESPPFRHYVVVLGEFVIRGLAVSSYNVLFERLHLQKGGFGFDIMGTC